MALELAASQPTEPINQHGYREEPSIATANLRTEARENLIIPRDFGFQLASATQSETNPQNQRRPEIDA